MSAVAGPSAANFTQQDRPIRVETPLGEDALLLRGFTGREELSRPFRFELDMISERGDIGPQELVGHDVSFGINTVKGSERWFHGHVCRLNYLGHGDLLHMYTATVVPWSWFLTRRADCRIFQDKTVLEIVAEVVDEAGHASDLVFEVQQSLPQQTYTVQYRETDYNFISRLLEHHGLFYFFRHEQGRHTMVVADHQGVHEDAEDAHVRFQASLSRSELEREILDWNHAYHYRSGRWTHTDYDFEKPTVSLEAEVATEPRHRLKNTERNELFDYPGEFTEREESERQVRLRMEEEEVGFDIVEGRSTCRSFGSGNIIHMTEHEAGGHEERSYLMTSVLHRAELGGAYVTEGGEGSHRIYENSFTAVPRETIYRPPRLTPKPTIPGVQTAVVTGPAGEEIYPDEYGRVKVQFHWDRRGSGDEASSCWIRVASPWAGSEWGMIQIPRIGQEVVVSFLEGNPDRPLITGMVYNADNMPPYALADSKTQTGIKTRSSSGGGGENFNELRFEDRSGQEEIYLHAERDFTRVVENDDSLRVGFDTRSPGSQTIEVYGDRTETIETGNDEITVRRGDREVDVSLGEHTITAARKITLRCGQSTIELTPTAININSIQVSIGASASLSLDGGGSATLNAGIVRIN